MTRKRFKKLLMAKGCDRNWTNYAAEVVRKAGHSYAYYWLLLCSLTAEGKA